MRRLSRDCEMPDVLSIAHPRPVNCIDQAVSLVLCFPDRGSQADGTEYPSTVGHDLTLFVGRGRGMEDLAGKPRRLIEP